MKRAVRVPVWVSPPPLVARGRQWAQWTCVWVCGLGYRMEGEAAASGQVTRFSEWSAHHRPRSALQSLRAGGASPTQTNTAHMTTCTQHVPTTCRFSCIVYLGVGRAVAATAQLPGTYRPPYTTALHIPLTHNPPDASFGARDASHRAGPTKRELFSRAARAFAATSGSSPAAAVAAPARAAAPPTARNARAAAALAPRTTHRNVNEHARNNGSVYVYACALTRPKFLRLLVNQTWCGAPNVRLS